MATPTDIEKHDVEASQEKDIGVSSATVSIDHGSSSEEVRRAKEIQNKIGVLRVLRRGEEWLDEKMGIETRGIDRIPEEEKRPPSIINIVLLWWSLNVHVGVIPLGILGPEFGLSLNQSIAASVVGILVGALTTAFTGTLGPKLGLRAVASSRYSFGFWGAKICSVLNVIIGCGYSVVNVVIVGQMLSAVSDYTMSISVGIVIISVIGYVVSVFGYAVIHTFEKYSWIITLIIMCVLIGQAAPHVDPSLPSEETGLAFAGAWLSMFAINFSNSSGWCSIAADYYCNYPASTPTWKTFSLTWFGVVVPMIFSTVIGCCLGNAAITAAYPPYADAYENHGLGGLLLVTFHPIGWSKFCLIVLAFSVLGNNIANNYSSGLSMQLLGHYFHAVPRFIWSFLVCVVITVLGVAGKSSLSTIVSNFVALLGYWTISFTVILLLEDQLFRRHVGYNLNAWNQPDKLPIGAAAVLALLSGYLAGGVPGMSQTWFVGPLAAKFSGFPGDLGIFLSGVITLVVYLPARSYERKRFGR